MTRCTRAVQCRRRALCAFDPPCPPPPLRARVVAHSSNLLRLRAGVVEAGYTEPGPPDYELAVDNAVVPATPAARTAFMRALLSKLAARDIAEAFRAPVDAAAVPDYYTVVRDPMDLGTMAARLEAGVYVTLELFLADLRRIWSNARLYNAPETVFYKDACALEEAAEGEVYASTHWLR
jgi:histone acetyltransferase